MVAHDVANIRGQARSKCWILQNLELLVLQALVEGAHSFSVNPLHTFVVALSLIMLNAISFVIIGSIISINVCDTSVTGLSSKDTYREVVTLNVCAAFANVFESWQAHLLVYLPLQAIHGQSTTVLLSRRLHDRCSLVVALLM